MNVLLKSTIVAASFLSGHLAAADFPEEGEFNWTRSLGAPGSGVSAPSSSAKVHPMNPVETRDADFLLEPQTSGLTAIGRARKQKVFLIMPANVPEGGKAGKAVVGLARPEKKAIRFLIAPYPAGIVSATGSVVIPAGETVVSFPFSIRNDQLKNMDRIATLILSVPGAGFEISNTSVIFDDEPPPRVVHVSAPGGAVERPDFYYGHRVWITLDKPAADDGYLSIAANPASEVEVDSTAHFQKGQKTGYFDFDALDDIFIDGKVKVKFTISAAGKRLAKCTGYTIDNESAQINLALPAAISEGFYSTGTVKIGGILPKPLKISLSLSGGEGLKLPEFVMIPEGKTSASFEVKASDNFRHDGIRQLKVSASAPKLIGTTRRVSILDNEVSGYRFATSDRFFEGGKAREITISAIDIQGNVAAGHHGWVDLSAVLPGGGSLQFTPAAVWLNSGSWTGNVTLPVTQSAITGLRATDSNGYSGETRDFGLMRILDLKAADLLWDGPRGRIYASIPATAGGNQANQVVAIDPITMQVTGSVATSHDPGQLVLTHGGEYLYVAMNGEGVVAKIDLATMSVVQSFELGSDSIGNRLFARDMCAVVGQPDALIVSEGDANRKSWNDGVAVYDNGIARPLRIPTSSISGVRYDDLIEPSSDPAVFFGAVSIHGFSHLRLGENGMTLIDNRSSPFFDPGTVYTRYPEDIHSVGDKIFSTNGAVVDGPGSWRLGRFSTNGPVLPDLELNRVFYLEHIRDYDYQNKRFERIAAYDPESFNLIQRVSLPSPVVDPMNLIRWGSHGLAFSAGNRIFVLNNSQLVANEASADLATAVRVAPDPAKPDSPLTYKITVSNLGTAIARNPRLTVTVSNNQEIMEVGSTDGTPEISGRSMDLAIGDLKPGAKSELSIRVMPTSVDDVSCSARVVSQSIDPDFSNNIVRRQAGFRFQPGTDVVNHVNLSANNLIADPGRELLWASVPGREEKPLGASVVSIDPKTGAVSDPIPLHAEPLQGSIALSANGRFLYVGLSDVADVARIDLDSTSRDILRVPLGLNNWGQAGNASDIEVLDGDGTSILVTTTGDDSALVIDGTTPRPVRTGFYTVNRIERTSTAGIFVGYNNRTSSWDLTHLSVSGSGVSITKSVRNVVNYFQTDIRGGGDFLLSTSGEYVDSGTLKVRKRFGRPGNPCVDAPNNRIYQLTYAPAKRPGIMIRSFNATTNASVETREVVLPYTATDSSGSNLRDFLRWGNDGFAILGLDGNVYLTRFSQVRSAASSARGMGAPQAMVIPSAGNDPDRDGIPDPFEYLFATSPSLYTVNPMKLTPVSAEERNVIHISFPRRSGMVMPAYGYEVSSDLLKWESPEGVTETVVSSHVAEGVEIETVHAAIKVPVSSRRFVRLSIP